MKKKLLILIFTISAFIAVLFGISASAYAQGKPEVTLNCTTYEFQNKPLGPGFRVTDGKKTLQNNIDYTYKYCSGRVEPGKYYVTINFIGEYAEYGSTNEYFEITANKAELKLNSTSYARTGKPLGPGFKVIYKGKELEKNKDYTYKYCSGRIEPGNYYVAVTLTGNYRGELIGNFKITENKIDVILNNTSYEFQNKPLGPGFRVVDGFGAELKKNVDYTYKYSSGRIEPGTYSVTITLIGKYSGEITKEFNIVENNAEVTLNRTKYEFQNKPLGPGFTVSCKGKTLQKNIDYTYKYSSGRVEPGTYSVTITLTGNYRGTITKQFSITDNSINVRLNRTSYEYTGSPLGPGMTITDSSGKVLTYKTDYTVKYSSGRIDPGKYSVDITLQGDYRGAATAYFYVTPKSIKGDSIKLTPNRRAISASWQHGDSFTNGYYVEYSENSSFNTSKYIKISNSSSTSCEIKQLFDDTKYFIRVRAYTVVNNEEIASPWSSAQNAVTLENEMIITARTELGNKGGKNIWQWAGYKSRVAWCCLFVGWVGDQNGYVEANVIPVYQQPKEAAEWFDERGLLKPPSYTPHQGDLIFFDWNGYGYPHHIGIVEKVENGAIHTIEGNAYNPHDTCARLTYSVNSTGIYGYATPKYR